MQNKLDEAQRLLDLADQALTEAWAILHEESLEVAKRRSRFYVVKEDNRR
jgi:hypothetical protein